jgi:hypothetical protein
MMNGPILELGSSAPSRENHVVGPGAKVRYESRKYVDIAHPVEPVLQYLQFQQGTIVH